MSEKFMSRFADCEYTISKIDRYPKEFKEFVQCKIIISHSFNDFQNNIEHWKRGTLFDPIPDLVNFNDMEQVILNDDKYIDFHDVIYFNKYDGEINCVLPTKLFEWCLINNKDPFDIWYNFSLTMLSTFTFEQCIKYIKTHESDGIMENNEFKAENSEEYWKEVAKYFGCDPDNTEDVLVKSYN